MVGILCFQCVGGAAGLISGGNYDPVCHVAQPKKKISRF